MQKKSAFPTALNTYKEPRLQARWVKVRRAGMADLQTPSTRDELL